MGPYLAFIAAIYRVSKPQRPYLGHVIGLGAPLLFPPSGSCLGTLFRGVLIGLKFWYAKTVSANQHYMCHSPYSSHYPTKKIT